MAVRSVRPERIGSGQIGICVRYELDVGDAPADVPRSLVGKFPSDDALSRATGVSLRNYYREVSFYRELADSLSINTPRCYYAAIDGEGPEFALLLEDLAPARQGDQLAGCSVEVACSAIRQLVGLQVPSWCDATLKRHDWLWQEAVPSDAMMAMYGQLLPGFIDRYGASLAADERDIIERVARSPGCPLFQPVGSTFCLEHVDYRLDNMLIDESSAPPRVTVVDWQSVKIGKPLNDVAYFLGASLLPEMRRDVECDIVGDYHAALCEAGIDDLEKQDCWEGYRRGAFAGFGVTVIASMIVEQTARGDQMFIVMARRHARHALDVAAEEWLE